MLAGFRNNHAPTALLLAGYVAVLRLPAILGWIPPPGPLPETEGGLLFWHTASQLLANTMHSAIAAAILVYIQAWLINRLADTYRLFEERNWFPGALYALAASAVPDFLFLTPVLIACTFLPISLRQIFSIYKQSPKYGGVFDAAFWITLASLWYPPAIWCLPAAYLALLNLRSVSMREKAVFLTGIFVPLFLALTGYFWYEQAEAFLQSQFNAWLYLPFIKLPTDLFGMAKYGLIALILLISLLGFQLYYYKKLIQVQKCITILYWFMFAGLAAALLRSELRLEYFLLVMPSVSIFLTYLFQSIRIRILAELIHLILLGAVFAVQFFHLIF